MNTDRTSVVLGSLLQYSVKIVVLRTLQWFAYVISFFGVLVSSNVMSQSISDDRKVPFDVGNCKMYDSEQAARAKQRNAVTQKWDGGCIGGFADGVGIVRMYQHGQLRLISKAEFKNGLGVRAIEVYEKQDGSIKKADMNRKTTSDIPPSQVPEWAREIVDGRSRQSTPANLASKQPAQKSSSTTASSTQNTSGESYSNRLAAVYNSQYFSLPVVYTDDRMLRDVKRIYSEILEYNRADASVQADECPSGVTRGPYFGFVHYQNDSGQAAGMACSASSPEEAYRLAQEGCIKKGGRCSGGKHGKFIVIGDRRIAEGKASWAEKNNVVVFTRERTVRYEPGKKVYFTEKYNFSEGYVCHWQNGQMITNGPFTAEGTQPRGNYEFNCGSKY